jgi:hypothetical protein
LWIPTQAHRRKRNIYEFSGFVFDDVGGSDLTNQPLVQELCAPL